MTGALAGAAGVVTHVGSHRGEGFERPSPWVDAGDRHRLGHSRLRTSPRLQPAGAGRTPAPAAPGDRRRVGGHRGRQPGRTGRCCSLAGRLRRAGLGLCLDTAHLFAAGYAVHQADGLEALVAELQPTRPPEPRRPGASQRLGAPFASKRDRHANPGEGELGYAGLARVVRHPALAHVPFVLEVPGARRHGPGAAEIALVKTMRRGGSRPATKRRLAAQEVQQRQRDRARAGRRRPRASPTRTTGMMSLRVEAMKTSQSPFAPEVISARVKARSSTW